MSQEFPEGTIFIVIGCNDDTEPVVIHTSTQAKKAVNAAKMAEFQSTSTYVEFVRIYAHLPDSDEPPILAYTL